MTVRAILLANRFSIEFPERRRNALGLERAVQAPGEGGDLAPIRDEGVTKKLGPNLPPDT
jgi:hypothetical protein